MSEPMRYQFAAAEMAVVVHFEGATYSFTKSGAPLQHLMNARTRAILRALLNAALDDLDAQVQS